MRGGLPPARRADTHSPSAAPRDPGVIDSGSASRPSGPSAGEAESSTLWSLGPPKSLNPVPSSYVRYTGQVKVTGIGSSLTGTEAPSAGASGSEGGSPGSACAAAAARRVASTASSAMDRITAGNLVPRDQLGPRGGRAGERLGAGRPQRAQQQRHVAAPQLPAALGVRDLDRL